MTLAIERLPYRIVCQVCDEWDAEVLTVLEAAAINRVLTGDPKKTGVKNRCSRYNTGIGQGALYRCGGRLRVEP